MIGQRRTDCSNVDFEEGPGAAKTDPVGHLNLAPYRAVRIAKGVLNSVSTRDLSMLSNEEIGCWAFRLQIEHGQFQLWP